MGGKEVCIMGWKDKSETTFVESDTLGLRTR